MIAGVYDIKITGLGFFPKFGKLSIRTVDVNLSGSLTVNRREIPFNFGSFLGNRLELEGDLALPVGKLNYTAKGDVTDGVIKLVMETEKGRLILTGKRKGDV